MSDRMPALFLGHGNPMHALARNAYTEAWSALGRSIPRPRAVLCVSAHWYAHGTAVAVSPAPRTIHDFGGFPPELYRVQYPAPGDPDLARRAAALLAPLDVALDPDYGLDHGAWCLLRHLYPDASVPVVQLSLDRTQPAPVHYDLGRRLASLRDENVLLLGSGNLVHNLRAYAWGNPAAPPYDWAERFERDVRARILARDHEPLIDYSSLGRDAALSIPTPDHYLPLLYVLGASRPDDAVAFPVEGCEGGSISMLAVRFGS